MKYILIILFILTFTGSQEVTYSQVNHSDSIESIIEKIEIEDEYFLNDIIITYQKSDISYHKIQKLYPVTTLKRNIIPPEINS